MAPEKQKLSASSAPPASREGPGNRQYGRVENASSKDAVASKYAALRDPFKSSSGGNYRVPPKPTSDGNLRDPLKPFSSDNYGDAAKTSSGNTAKASSTQPPQTPALIDLHSAPGSRNPGVPDSSDRSGFILNWDSMKSGWQNFGTKRFAPMRQDKASSESQPTSSQTLDSIFQGLRANRGSTDEEDLRLLR
jgi:hypothetical protein